MEPPWGVCSLRRIDPEQPQPHPQPPAAPLLPSIPPTQRIQPANRLSCTQSILDTPIGHPNQESGGRTRVNRFVDPTCQKIHGARAGIRYAAPPPWPTFLRCGNHVWPWFYGSSAGPVPLGACNPCVQNHHNRGQSPGMSEVLLEPPTPHPGGGGGGGGASFWLEPPRGRGQEP